MTGSFEKMNYLTSIIFISIIKNPYTDIGVFPQPITLLSHDRIPLEEVIQCNPVVPCDGCTYFVLLN